MNKCGVIAAWGISEVFFAAAYWVYIYLYGCTRFSRHIALGVFGRAIRVGRGGNSIEANSKSPVVQRTVGLGRQRRRLFLYIKKAHLCENGRGLRTHQSCDLYIQEYRFRVYIVPGSQGRGGLIFEPPRRRRFKDQTSEGALLRPFFAPVKKCVLFI